MYQPASFIEDFDLAHRCLEGDERALAALQNEFGEAVKCFLIRAGAQSLEAREVVESMWSDLLTCDKGRVPRLYYYHGNCALSTWLNTVALNSLLSRKREEKLAEARRPKIDLDPELSTAEALDGAPASSEPPVIDMMHQAIEAAFAHCDPEEFVMLQLAHCDRLQGQELARMFGCTAGNITRRLAAAQQKIERRTLEFVRERDPWLELRWEDFIELCRTATPACFGQET